MNITKFSINRPVGIMMIYALIAVLGIASYFRIGVELLPDVDSRFITVMASYPGASPESIEQQVTKPIENELSSLSHFKRITSATRPGRAEIFIELDPSADTDLIAVEASKKLSILRKQLPSDMEEPIVYKRSGDEYPIQQIAVSGPGESSELYALAENSFKELLQRADGVADIELSGGRKRQVAIEVDRDRLSYYGLTLKDITQAVRDENIIVSGGAVYSDKLQISTRITGQYNNIKDIELVQLKTPTGQVALKDIATVQLRDARAASYSRVDGNATISMEIYKISGANIVNTADNVLVQLEKLKKAYPDYQFTLVYDQAEFVRKSLSNTMQTLIEGLITTGLVLFLFLRGWRSSVAVMIAIPTSLIATFFLMYLAGFTFNMMSLMGMCLCIGILVDDSIVVLENIHRYLKEGMAADKAAEVGRNEIGTAAIAMTLCDIVVFLPIAFLESSTGKFFREFGLTIVFATLMSLFVSFTLTPMLASKFYKEGYREAEGSFWDRFSAWEQSVIDKYEKLLRSCLDKPKRLLIAVIGCFVISIALVPLGIVGSEYMPRTDESAINVSIEMPTGYNAEQTNEILELFDEYLQQLPELKHYMSNVTSTESNGKLSITLVGRGERERSVFQIADAIRRFTNANLGNAKVRVTPVQSSVAGVSGGKSFVRSPVQVELKGNTLEKLVQEAHRVEELFKNTEGLKDIKNSYVEGMPELRLVVDREKLNYYRISLTQVSKAFGAALGGREAGVLANNAANHGRDTDIVVKLAGSHGFYIDDLKHLAIQTGSGAITLGDVAEIKESVGPTVIRRTDKERIINIQANLSNRPLNDVVREIKQKLDKAKLDCSYSFAGDARTMNDAFRELAIALGMSLLLIYLLLAVLYESAVTPIIRMFSLPLGIIGALFFLLITGNTINLYSLIGILVMDGLVAKNGTLLLDYTMTLIGQGWEAREAVIEAGRVRLKPIFMTAITMVVGMLPTALALGEGAETRVSMAWVIIGGMLSSTVFTLLVIPILFLRFGRFGSK